MNKLKVKVSNIDGRYDYIINGRVVAMIKKYSAGSCFWDYRRMEASLKDWTDRGYDEAKDIVEFSIIDFFDRYGIEVEFER